MVIAVARMGIVGQRKVIVELGAGVSGGGVVEGARI